MLYHMLSSVSTQINEGICSERVLNADSGIIVQDARRLRQCLATKLLLNPQSSEGGVEARKEFLASLEDATNDIDVLRHSLLPVVTEVGQT
jgi:hypothetical protein